MIDIFEIFIIIFVVLFGFYLKIYVSEKAKKLATREEFELLRDDLRLNTEITEKIKNTVQRAETAKSKGAEELNEIMSSIEALLQSWAVLLYFNLSESDDFGQLEKSGRSNLKPIAEKIIQLNRVVSKYKIYFSKELISVVHEWSQEVYQILFEYEAVYNTSLSFFKDKPAGESTPALRIKLIQELSQDNITPMLAEISEHKNQFNIRLRKELGVEN